LEIGDRVEIQTDFPTLWWANGKQGKITGFGMHSEIFVKPDGDAEKPIELFSHEVLPPTSPS